jgi:hypothetical protein
MRRLHHENLHIFEEDCVQRIAHTHRLAQFRSCDLLTFAGSLDVGVMRRLITAQYDRRSAHSFAPDETDLDAFVALLNRDNRRESGLHEIGSRDRPVGPFKVAFEGKRVLTVTVYRW